MLPCEAPGAMAMNPMMSSFSFSSVLSFWELNCSQILPPILFTTQLLWQKVRQFALFMVKLEHGHQMVKSMRSLPVVSSEGWRNSSGDQDAWLTDCEHTFSATDVQRPHLWEVPTLYKLAAFSLAPEEDVFGLVGLGKCILCIVRLITDFHPI